MKFEPLGIELTYCTNVHPGESLADVQRALRTHVAEVKRRVCPDAAFGIGLRLGAQAAFELEAPGALDELRDLLREQGLYVFTLNGFPYGSFHASRVKENVYRPDWLEPERVRYTNALARTLSALLPLRSTGSVSSVPVCFGPRLAEARTVHAVVDHLLESVAELVRLERERGTRIVLALEPEPSCALETSGDVRGFFEGILWTSDAISRLGRLAGLDSRGAEAALRTHVGVCLDACHAAVEFESAASALSDLRAAGIAVPKIQVSAGLSAPGNSPETRAALAAFADDVYLHQVVIRDAGGELRQHLDLPVALAEEQGRFDESEWRVHFHVPVFARSFGAFGSTAGELSELLRTGDLSQSHLEVETYTFDVLPEEHRQRPVEQMVADELTWTLAELSKRG